MGDTTTPVPTGISDITFATEVEDESNFPPLLPGTSHVPNDSLALVPSHEEAVFSPVDSLLRDRIPTTPTSFVPASPVGISGPLVHATGMPSPSTPLHFAQRNQANLTQNLQMIDARQVVVNQDHSPMAELAPEARHSQIIGELGAEHQEQLRHMYSEGLAEVSRLKNELGNANIALSIQRSEMGQGEVKFRQTENAKEFAVMEASKQAEAARKATEEAHAQNRRLCEVETSARRIDALRSHEVADLSSRMDELMRQLQAQRQQTEVLVQQNNVLTIKVREYEARDAAVHIQEGLRQGPPPGIPIHNIATPNLEPKHGGDTPTEQATDAGRRTPPEDPSPKGGDGPSGNGPSDDGDDKGSSWA